jgi:hypothetical protein
MPCPWGEIQFSEVVADGIAYHTTARHGGFVLSQERYEQMPEHLRNCSYTKDQWFEQDCSAVAVYIAFPQFFSEEQVARAKELYELFYGNAQWPE